MTHCPNIDPYPLQGSVDNDFVTGTRATEYTSTLTAVVLAKCEGERLRAEGTIGDLGTVLPLALLSASFELQFIRLHTSLLMNTSLPLQFRDRIGLHLKQRARHTTAR